MSDWTTAATLVVDTATPTTTVAWLEAGRLRSWRSAPAWRGARARLITLMDETLREAGRSPVDVSLVAAGSGPGSFTGLRVGLAAAAALALRRGVPVLPVSTLLAMCYSAPRTPGARLIPLLVARAELVIAAEYVADEQATGWRQLRPPWLGPVQDVVAWVEGPTHWCGSGLQRHGGFLREALGGDFAGDLTGELDIDGPGLARAVSATLADEAPIDAHHLQPAYGEQPRARRIDQRPAPKGGRP